MMGRKKIDLFLQDAHGGCQIRKLYTCLICVCLLPDSFTTTVWLDICNREHAQKGNSKQEHWPTGISNKKKEGNENVWRNVRPKAFLGVHWSRLLFSFFQSCFFVPIFFKVCCFPSFFTVFFFLNNWRVTVINTSVSENIKKKRKGLLAAPVCQQSTVKKRNYSEFNQRSFHSETC